MTDTVSQIVTVNPAPVIDVGPFQGCYQATLTAPGGYASYVWTTETGSVIASGTNSITVDSAGLYYVTVVDFNGCAGTSSPIQAIIHVAPEVNAFPDTVYVSDGALAQLNVETVTGDDVSYTWYPPEDLTCSTCETTLAYSVGEENTYYVTGEENGCVSLPDSIIVVMSESEFIIPNAFTPNEDGLNDDFHILNPIFYPSFTFDIYNRWGQMVFSTNDVLQGWDGTFDNIAQEIGMYIWVVKYEKANQPGQVFSLRGTVTLLR
jgi:gliding motility-associated-like protein